jgi:KipI family sensor histidine kinase inhibitor
VSAPASLRIRPAGESAILVELADAISQEATDRVLRLTAAVEAAALAGVTDLAPGYVTLLVMFDPAVTAADALAQQVTRLAATSADAPLPSGKIATFPVSYGGEHGPDLERVAAHAGLSKAEVIARHAAADYRVACPGFVPGWAYLTGLPAELATPRQTAPRTRVPAGSVAIGGAQAGVYPFETPGGWNLIGRSPHRPFDPTRPDPILLHPGDRVRFVPISAAQYETGAPADWQHSGAPLRTDGSTRHSALGTRHSVQVLAPGLLTTVQDLGRPGRMRDGIGREGALDRAALILGNRLVGNDPGAAGLEITLTGPHLRFERAAVVAVTGGDLGATLDGEPLPLWQPVLVPAGGEIPFRPDRAAACGARAYLCVAGGVDVPPVLGGRGTYLAIGIGGHEGRALRAGDVLLLGQPGRPLAALLRRRLAGPPPVILPDLAVRVVLGPQVDRFTADGIANLLGAVYRASARSDRMGLRLEGGPPVVHSRGPDLISEGLVPGSIQVPGDALPIVLLNAAATAGGYPKIATAIGADLDRLAQVRPGDLVRFAAVTSTEARNLTLAHRATLGEDAVVERPVQHPGWTGPDGAVGLRVESDPALDGIGRLVDALQGCRFAEVRLELTTGKQRLRLDLRRRSGQGAE